MRNQKGFTLIELLVVIAILGILAAVVVPAVASFIGSGEDESMETERQNVGLAIGACMTEGDGTYAVSSINTSTDYLTGSPTGTNGFTRDMTGFLAGCTTSMSIYLENSQTKWCYSWGTDGRVTQCTVSNPDDDCTGC